MAYDQIAADALTELDDLDARRRAALEDLEEVDRIDHAPQDDCWQWHAGCLADRIRRTLTGEGT